MSASVKEAIWNGKIPLEIHLDDPEGSLSSAQAAHSPFYVLESRLSYLPLLIPQVRRHFASLMSQAQAQSNTNNNNVTRLSGEFDDFEEERLSSASRSRSLSSVNGSSNEGFFTAVFGEERIGLPWHLPLGLLFDLNCCCRLSDSGQSEETDTKRSNFALNAIKSLPFKITFHLSPTAHLFTQERLLPSLSLTAPIPLEEALTSIYFAALKESDYVRCGSAKNVMNLSRTEQMQLWESVKTGHFDRFWRTNVKLTGFSVKALPVKLWLLSAQGEVRRFAVSVRVEKEALTLKEWLIAEFGAEASSMAVLCHGILVPEQVRIQDLAASFCYADNFLHLILLINS